MNSPELGLPSLSPPPGGLARLQTALRESPRAQPSRWRQAALAGTAFCGLLVLAHKALDLQRERALAAEIDSVLLEAARSVPIEAKGFVMSEERRLANGTRVFELRRTTDAGADDPPHT